MDTSTSVSPMLTPAATCVQGWLGMKTDGNGRENLSTIFVSVFITENESGSGIAGYGSENRI